MSKQPVGSWKAQVVVGALIPLGNFLLPGELRACQATQSAGQEGARADKAYGVLVGKVLSFDGKPAANATVTLVCSEENGLWQYRQHHFIQAKTDEKGRFKAAGLRRRPYSAWAIRELADSQYRATMIYSDVFAGTPVVMREYKKSRHRLRVRLKGHASWRKRGPLRCTVMLQSASGTWQSFEPDKAGVAVLPPMPDEVAVLRILNHKGLPLVDPSQCMQSLAPDEDKIVELNLGQLYPLAIKVRADTRDGLPIAGASICATGMAVSSTVIGVTNKEGIAYFEHPLCRSEMFAGTLSYVVRRRARGVVQGNLILGARDETRTMEGLRASGKVDDEIVMMRGSRLSGRLWISNGQPAKDISLRLDMSVPLGPEVITSGKPIRTRTDAQGRFSFESCNRGFAYRLSCYIKPGMLPQSRADSDEPLQGLILLAQDITGFSKDTRLDDLFVDLMRPLRIQVRDSQGQPVFAPVLHLVDAKSSFGEKVSVPDSLSYVGNEHGGLRILVPDVMGRPFLVAVSPQSEGVLAIPSQLPKAALQIRLQPTTWIRGRVIDHKGNPVAGAPVGIAVDPRPGSHPRFGHPSYGAPPKTNAEGRFEIEVCTHRKYTLTVGPPGSGAMYRVTAMTSVEVDGSPVKGLEITIPSSR